MAGGCRPEHDRIRLRRHLDVLVGLAVGDEAMIRERLNTREAGNLLDEINAHRLRVNYGPHLVRVTRQDMAAWMPDVPPDDTPYGLIPALGCLRVRRHVNLPRFRGVRFL